VVTITWAGLRFRWSRHYVSERVIRGPGGEGPGAFGRGRTAAGGWWGPPALAASGRAIAVDDSVNHRLQVFNSRGRLTQTNPLVLRDGTRFHAAGVLVFRIAG